MNINVPGIPVEILLVEDNPGDVPVVVLTTSTDEKDVLEAYEHRANAYIVKPVDFGQFFKAVRSLEDFWLTVVKLPGDNQSA